MSNMCVCHIEGEWCFYCAMYSPLEDKYREAQTEIARLQAFIQHESESAIDAVQELERLRLARDYWRKEAKDANLLNAELEGECVGHMEQNRKLGGILANLLGLISAGYLTITEAPSAVEYVINDAREALSNGEKSTQEDDGR